MVVSSSFRMTTRGCVFLRFWGGIFGVRRPDALLPSHHSSTPGLISGSYCYFQISFRYHQRSSNIKYFRYNQVSLYIYIYAYIYIYSHIHPENHSEGKKKPQLQGRNSPKSPYINAFISVFTKLAVGGSVPQSARISAAFGNHQNAAKMGSEPR